MNSSFPASNSALAAFSSQLSAARGIQPARIPLTRNCSPSRASRELSTTRLPSGERMPPPADCTASAKLTVRPS